MKKFSETDFYKKWYKQVEELELAKIEQDRVLKEWRNKIGEYNETELSAENKAILYAICIQKTQLKSPSQAVFPDFDEFKVRKTEDDLVEVSGYCDAPNSYGAMTRGKFTVRMRYDEQEPEYVVLKEAIENKMMGTGLLISFIIIAILMICAPVLLL